MQTDSLTMVAQPETLTEERFLRRLCQNPRFRLGLAICAVPILIAAFGQHVAPHDPLAFVDVPFSSARSLSDFGTDNLGRDVFSRFLSGGRKLVLISALSTIIGVSLGGMCGALLATVRGSIDEISMRLADVALAFPPIVLALMCLSLIGPVPWLIVAVVALGHFPRTLRVIRGAAMSVAERDFVKYNESLGFGRFRTMIRDVLPNVTAPLMVEFGIRFTFSVGLVASLSFLGLGVQPPNPDWGNMINENRLAVTIQPWGVLLPLGALVLLAVGCNLISDGISRTAGFVSNEQTNG
ncbi:MAG: ABC transporter permease [Mesorhizobium sp.]|nr:MAG: ABC transporter permease [Mesorhizobium sp.]TJW89152.1 MAG: ABC transporter permease [Mesorhizobium sp.]